MVLRTVSNAGLQNVIVTATILENESVEQGVCAANLSRFVRTPASRVVDAIAVRQVPEFDPCFLRVAKFHHNLRWQNFS